MSEQKRDGITREELARRITVAVANVPRLGWHDWKTIYLALSRERRRVQHLLDNAEDSLPDTDPDVRQWIGKLRGEIAHVQKIMAVLGERGRNMNIRGVGRNIRVVDDDLGDGNPSPEPSS